MLRFVLTGFLMAAPLAVAAQERLPNLYDVTVVETWDKLNVRAAPDGQAEIIGTLASFGWAMAVAYGTLALLARLPDIGFGFGVGIGP